LNKKQNIHLKKSTSGKKQRTFSNSDTTQIMQSAIASSISPIAFVDKDDTVIYVNNAFLSIWGYTADDDIIGMSADRFWDMPGTPQSIERKIRERGGWIGELTAFRKNRSTFPAQVSITILSVSDEVSECRMYTFVDISERVNAQLEQQRLLTDLQERVKELKCLYTILSVPNSQVLTLESILEYIVQSIPDSLRWPQHAFARVQLGSLDIRTVNYQDDPDSYKIPLETVHEQGILDVGYRNVNDTAGTMTLLNEEKEMLIAASGEIVRLIEYKWTESELAKNREYLLHADKLSSIGVLSAEIMHEINNPNNFIALNSKIVTQAWLDIMPILDEYYRNNGDYAVAGLTFDEARAEIPRLLDGISEGTERIRAITNRLQSFITRRGTTAFTLFDINDAIEKAIEFSKHLIVSSTDHFSVNLSKDPLMVRGDFFQIQQILINFITNACQALTKKTDSICIFSLLSENSVMVRVDDTGIGIDSKELARVMDPFYSTKRISGCTGLGLSISNDIAVSHGGKIQLNSSAGSGTSAMLILPVAQ
jgi:PAS domain S-box-containing protein